MSPAPGAVVLLPFHAQPGDDIPPLEGWTYFTNWSFAPFPLVMILLTAGAYLYGVHLLRRRGDSWPVGRTISFVLLGCGSLFVALFSFLGAYDTVLFWVHMVQHMLLNLIAPVFLVFGAPATLLLRTLPKQPRAWLLKLLHSRFAKALLFPPLTTLLMVGSPFVLYLTGWYDLTLRNDLAHDALHVWLLVLGCLFFFPLLGVDPVPLRIPYPIRCLLFFLTMPFHAFLGVIIMSSTTLIAEEWYLAFERSWGLSPIDDQTWAGALMWATGDLTMLAAMSTIFIQWVKESNREGRRMNRQFDREDAVAARRPVVAPSGEVGYDSASGAVPGETAERGGEDGEKT